MYGEEVPAGVAAVVASDGTHPASFGFFGVPSAKYPEAIDIILVLRSGTTKDKEDW